MKTLNKQAENIFVKHNRSDWELAKFGDIAKNISERVDPNSSDADIYVGLEHLDSDSIHIRRFGVPSDVKGVKLRVYKGDIIFGKRRAYQRKASIAEFDGICSAHAMVVRADSSHIEPDFLPFFMHSDAFMNRAIDISEGSLSPTIKWKILAQQKFLLPPRQVQKKILGLLIASDQLEEKYRIAADKINLTLKTIFAELTKNKLDRKKLGECLKLSKMKSAPPHKLEKYLGLEHIEPGSFNVDAYGDAQQSQSSCNVFKSGQLLYSKLRPNLDKAVIPSFDGVCTTELLVYDATPDIDIEYVLHHLHSDGFIHYAVSLGFGTKMPRISHKIVSEYKIYVPTLEKQKDILRNLAQLTEIKKQLQNSIELTRAMRNAILTQVIT
ncbi:MAG: hypothetical protein A2845_05945 [Candidatus Lloydbacteria bacterium RIFCSPHIGHO2_01_FULL_49_22]|uniref:Type I restriction modification DNA specificity domain-containing protein n=1 Tax=Candidatus Lloydbacteria bacterium RIFCSPHIGHO2_01_FULL_49_22 TaxID=1798658 RepID=A0A1G2CXV0_9BACT|nr:MAG: hypothetical protein A2845_05945 [Candidatus Lloydbacteria bacterium RIFCSPHIGHO2_01_FULL_49_22]OGZ09779.1 MAG: hypothetical protein A3C14_00070 [Candidatus Lloydbacteria bacterium RIFCSPHIGHO2_02_FULL_50_18]